MVKRKYEPPTCSDCKDFLYQDEATIGFPGKCIHCVIKILTKEKKEPEKVKQKVKAL